MQNTAQNPPLSRWCWSIYVVALAVRLLLILGFHRYELVRAEPQNIAVAIAQKGEFADPYILPTGATAHTGPVFPALLAPFYYFFGNTVMADRVRVFAGPLLGAIPYALLPLAAFWLRLPLLAGLLAGFFGALVPVYHYMESLNQFEAPLIAVVLILSLSFLARPVRPVWEGLFWGIAFLLAPVLLPTALALALFRCRDGFHLRRAAVVTGVAMTLLSPWIIRNSLRLGGVYFVRDDLGLELAESNRDGATPNFLLALQGEHYQTTHPHQSARVAQQIQSEGEAAFEREQMQRAKGWIRTHPVEFGKLTMERVFLFWFPWLNQKPTEYLLRLMSVTGFAGLLYAWVKKEMAAAPLTFIWVSFGGIYYLIETYVRYSYPLWWSQLLIIAYLAVEIAPKLRAFIRGQASAAVCRLGQG